MGRKKVERTPSQEAIFQADKRKKDAERKRKRRSEQTEEEREAEKNQQKKYKSDTRQQHSEAQKAERNATETRRIQTQRANFDDERVRAERVAARLRMQRLRNREAKLCAAGYEIDDEGVAHYGGPLKFICDHCGAKHFESEKVSGKGASFYSCCQHGTIKLIIPDYPEELKPLFDLAEFRKDIRVLNNAHSFGSFNADVVNFGVNRPGPYAFVVQGQVYYQMNTSILNEDEEPKSHGQLYIVDPEEAAENRLNVFNKLNPDIVKKLSTVLSQINEQAKAFKMLYEEFELMRETAEVMGLEPPSLSLHFGIKPGQDKRRYNLQASNEVAAVFATNDDGEIPDSYVTIYDKDQKELRTVNAMDPNVEPWLYPIFFPTGKAIWHPDLKKVNSNQRLTRSAYVKYMISIRDGEFNAILHGGRLFQQWLVDTALKILKDRVNYLKTHQQQLLRDSYANIDEYMKKFQQDNNVQKIGAKYILPSSHPGSPRNMEQLYQDAMSVVRRYGKPDLFITMTCNPNWTEISENLLPGQTAADRPDLVARVFKQKKDHLLNLVTKEGYFGKCKAHVYTVEFQKRGLPHIHLLVTLEGDYKMRTAEVIDRYISAQLPDPELYPKLHELVVKHMIHGPCGDRCMKDGKCSKHFPHDFQEKTEVDEDGYPSYARPDNGITVTKSSGFVVDNRYVVPHCPNLLLEMNCHINVEVVSSIKAVKYIYKYIFKGHDSAAFKIVDGEVIYDECTSFLDSRYMGSAEACWRVLGFELHGQSHSITRLPLHLPGEQKVSFVDAENEDELKAAMEKMSMLMEYFELNKRDPKARQFYYHEIPEKYTWKKVSAQGEPTKMQWSERKAHFNVIGRMYSVSPTNQELFHLRILLNHVKGAKSFEDLKTVEINNEKIVYQSFTQTCLELGLVKDDKEWEKVLNEAKLSLLPYQMRMLFVRLLIHCNPLAPHDLWEQFKGDMSDDFAMKMTEETAIKKAYREIQRILEIENKSLADFPTMPQNVDFDEEYDIYDPIHDQEIGDQMFGKMNIEQQSVVEKVCDAGENNNCQKLFYLDGPGGSGKTFTYTTLWHLLRAKGKKVATMAFTGIAAILLPEGRTCHKTLGLTVPLYSDSNSTVTPNSKHGKKLLDTDVFIWDEAPMAPKYALEIMDRLLRELTKIDEPFGGKILLLGGDFRQLLPVRKNGTKSECISLSIKRSDLWQNFEKLTLTKNMRADEDATEFANFLLKIGEGKFNDIDDNIEFPEGFEVETDLVQEVFGHLIAEKRYEDVANSAILSARNADVDELNKAVVELLPNEYERRYTSVDTAIEGEALQELLTQEYLNSLNPASLPPHELNLKKNTVVMLIRNLSQAEGLCNGTRLLVIGLHNHTLQCKILTGDKKGEVVFLHRILLYNEENYPFKLARRQFPVKIAFAMTINKSQGQTFEKVGLDLRKDVFNHGQLYVACSRVKKATSLKIYLGKQSLFLFVVYLRLRQRHRYIPPVRWPCCGVKQHFGAEEYFTKIDHKLQQQFIYLFAWSNVLERCYEICNDVIRSSSAKPEEIIIDVIAYQNQFKNVWLKWIFTSKAT